ncbi:serine/threonine protein kinase [Frankia sp. Mgl5]|nr:serine/threonine protein kinase [Frankia sp. Mgl5]
MVLSGQDRLRREVAIKIVHGLDGAADNAETEALTLARLDHPHVVRVYDYIPRDGLALIVMELLDGGTLRARAVRGLSTEQVCAIGLATAAALGYAHERGVLHRDVKPANVLFTRSGRLKVADFGIAREYTGSALQTATAVGTPRYMAPEQFLAGRLGPFTDLYALGVILYELLAGRPPFRAAPTDAQSFEGLRRSHLGAPPPPLRGSPAPLGAVVLRALEKRPDDRYRTARDFSAALARASYESLGPGWLERAGLVLDLDDDIRALAAGEDITLRIPARDSAAGRDVSVVGRMPEDPERTALANRVEPPAPPQPPQPSAPPRPPTAPRPPSPPVPRALARPGGAVRAPSVLQQVVGDEPRVVIRTGSDAEYRRFGYRTAVVAVVLLGALCLLVAMVLALT